MAHGRPVSRHGGYDAFKGRPVENTQWGDIYSNQDFSSPRPKSGYKKRSYATHCYDSYARMTDFESQEKTEKEDQRQRKASDAISIPDDNPTSPAPSHQMSQFHGSPEHQPITSPLPPKTKGSRPPSGRKSSRQHHNDIQMTESYLGDPRASPSIPTSSRPPSSFSVYRTLPAIGDPTPRESEISGPSPPRELWEQPNQCVSSMPPTQPKQTTNSSHLQRISRDHLRVSDRISSAVSDISVISSKASSRRRSDETVTNIPIERLDLSQLHKSDSGRRKKPVNHSSPQHRPKSGLQNHSKYDSGELYDGDDDDSDSNNTHGDPKDLHLSQATGTMSKEPVIIPSENGPPPVENDQEILLAIKLPSDGTRHQRYFQRNEYLMSIVEFAEEQANQDFAGYILVSNAPKTLYDDLRLTIEEAGLEDKTVLHLEECD